MSFDIPDEVERAFRATLAGEDGAAVIADLMRQAVTQRPAGRRAAAIDALLALRSRQPAISTDAIARARRAGRP
jgi:hypothetical protein